MSAPAAYPLAWPQGWPREKARTKSLYRTTLSGALAGLQKELRLFGGTGLVLSSNVTLGAESPADPGVVAYFTHGGQQIAIPCDRWNRVECNVQAIRLTIAAMREMERHGAKHMIRAMFQGFIALPAPTLDWRAVLGHPNSLEAAEVTYRRLMAAAHPDRGGTHEAAAELNAAIEAARKALPR